MWFEFNWGDANTSLFLLFCFGFILQMWYYLTVFARLAFYNKKASQSDSPPVSVIICARNEDDNLVENLPHILSQDYPVYEVVVVDDCSFDHTADILKEFAQKDNRIKIVTIKEDEYFSHGKKFAVMVGIKGAKYDHLVFTDADCKPNSSVWLKNMASEMVNDTEIVLGYGGYEKKKGFLNKFIRFDTYMIALQYLSFCLSGKTYMGVGRNMAYKKDLFFKMKGFASHYQIESGDDDLFVNEAATKRNSKIEVSLESHTISKVKTSFTDWLRQKRRHMTTWPFYNVKTKWRLGWLSLSQWMFFVFFTLMFFLKHNLWIVSGMFFLRLIIQLVIFKKTMDKLGERDLFILSPVLEVILLVFYPLFLFSGLTAKKVKWKKI